MGQIIGSPVYEYFSGSTSSFSSYLFGLTVLGNLERSGVTHDFDRESRDVDSLVGAKLVGMSTSRNELNF
jgi:hypothetical protein